MKKKMIAIGLGIVIVVMNACASAPSKSGENEAPAIKNDSAMWNRFEYDSETYLTINENKIKEAVEDSAVTVSLKVDTAAYTNVARYIASGQLPPQEAVKTEEFLNYFSYENQMEEKQGPFYISAEIGDSPYDDTKKIALIRVKTEEIEKEELPPSNLTFLIDTSGSMDSYDKLPLLKEAFTLLVETLGEHDKVSIVTYAGSSEVVLNGAAGTDKFEMIDAIHRLQAGGSTYGEGGIQTAYELAGENFIEGGNNRIILATDGDFNVGVHSESDLEQLITRKRESGIDLSILGFGTGNLKDSRMETLSKYGNGNYSYISSVDDAKKVLVEELGSTLFTVASDVKAQVEFNPGSVSNYRLIGYENRMMDNEDFDDDGKDAGEIGAGSDMVMMFELEMAKGADAKEQEELFELRIRYKEPGEKESREILQAAYREDMTDRPSEDFRFSLAVAGFAHLLRESEAMGDLDIEQIKAIAKDNMGADAGNYRKEFIKLINSYLDLPGSRKYVI